MPEPIYKNKSLIISTLAGIVYGLALWLIFGTRWIRGFEAMSLVFLLMVPFLIGLVTIRFAASEYKSSLKYSLFMPWVSVAVLFILTLLLEIEVVICLVLLAPVFMIAASFGGYIAYQWNNSESKKNNKALSLVLLAPFVLGPIEEQISASSAIQTVSTEITINASQAEVWQQLVEVEAIQPEELKWSFAHAIGIPPPISSHIEENEGQKVRKILWGSDIRFSETITDWQYPQQFSYKVKADHIPAEAIDPHIEVGGRYFDVFAGGYQLLAISPEQTKVKLYCTYRVSTHFNAYAKFWAHFILDDFQQVILDVIRKRSEKNILVK